MKFLVNRRLWIIGAGLLSLMGGALVRRSYQENVSDPGFVPVMPLRCELKSEDKQAVKHSASLQEHAITWTVTNTGKEPMRSLQPQVDCKCHLVKDFPEEILPNGSTTITIRVTAPQAGRSLRQIPVYCSSLQQIVGLLEVELDVPVQPPFWLDSPKVVRLQTIAGQPALNTCVWECIESANSAPYLTDVTLSDPVDDVAISVVRSESPWGEDKTLIKRAYEIKFQTYIRTPSVFKGLMAVRTSSTNSNLSFSLIIDAKSAISAFPPSIEFATDETTKSCTIVSRLLPVTIVSFDCDSDQVSIEPVDTGKTTGAVHKYRIRRCGTTTEEVQPVQPADCVVTFRLDDQSVQVPIRIHQ